MTKIVKLSVNKSINKSTTDRKQQPANGYENILEKMRSIMIQAKTQGNINSGGQLKMDLEKCFIDMRREFEIIALESQYQH